MKRIISLIIAIIMVWTLSLTVFATSHIDESSYDVVSCRPIPEDFVKLSCEELQNEYVLSGFIPEDINFISGELDLVTTSSTRSVAVTEPCDQEWRQLFPDSWMWEANRRILAADDLLNTRYGIRFYSVSQKYWDNDISSYNPSGMVANAHSEWGLRDGAKLMIAFTGKPLYAYTGSGYAGVFGLVEDIGDPYLLVSSCGYDEDIMTVRHEVGHCYGLTHCSSSTNCFMAEAAARTKYESVCSKHNTDWQTYKTKY